MSESKLNKIIKKKLSEMGFMVIRYAATAAGETTGIADFIVISEYMPYNFKYRVFFLESKKDQTKTLQDNQAAIGAIIDKHFAPVVTVKGEEQLDALIANIKLEISNLSGASNV